MIDPDMLVWGGLGILVVIYFLLLWALAVRKGGQDTIVISCGMGAYIVLLLAVFFFVLFPLMVPITQTDVFRVSEKAVIGDDLYLIGEGDRWYQINDPWAFYKIQPGQDVQVDAVYDHECVGRWSCNEKPPEITRVYWFGGTVG